MAQKIIRYVATNDRGLRIGEDHPNAKLSNVQIDELLNMREEGASYTELAKRFGVCKSAVRHYCNGARRCQWPASWKKIEVLVDAPHPGGARTALADNYSQGSTLQSHDPCPD